jgi:hypothetical protein
MSIKERAKLGVARLWTWKVCGELEGTGKTEEEWNALPLDERMKLGVARLSTWKACGELVGTGKTEEEWNALPLDERMKLGALAKLAPYHEALWNERYGELCQFYTDYGHSYVSSENKQLHSWVGYQKNAYDNGTMSLARKKLMEEICNFGDEDMKAIVKRILDKHTGGLQVIHETLGELDVAEDSFTSSDVLIVKKGDGCSGVQNLPGNQGLRAAISKHMPDDPSVGAKPFSSLAELVIDEIESLDPPGRFLELKPGNRCFGGINRARVIVLIKKRFRNMKTYNVQKSRDKGCPVTTRL